MIVYVWVVLMFVLGAVVGSFLNVCIARLPLEKSILWPLGSRCGHCLQPIRARDNVPLLSYWLLRGRCRTCGAAFSVRYFLVELLTGLGFAGLFYLEVVFNVHQLAILRANQQAIVQWGVIPWQGWVVFGHHAVLFSFLMITAACDLDHRDIPLSVTATGTLIGLVAAVCWPWPWPYSPAAATAGIRPGQPWWLVPAQVGPKAGLYAWPVWGPLPDWLAPGGNWQTGLVTGLAGLLAGTMLLRGVRFLFSAGMKVEALGLGDADIMMMAGSFLGWQPVVVAFFVAVVPALFFGIAQLIVYRDNALPFGPSLAIGLVATWLGWHWISPYVQPLFFNDMLMLVLAGTCGLFMLGSGYVLGLRRRTGIQGGK